MHTQDAASVEECTDVCGANVACRSLDFRKVSHPWCALQSLTPMLVMRTVTNEYDLYVKCVMRRSYGTKTDGQGLFDKTYRKVSHAPVFYISRDTIISAHVCMYMIYSLNYRFDCYIYVGGMKCFPHNTVHLNIASSLKIIFIASLFLFIHRSHFLQLSGMLSEMISSHTFASYLSAPTMKAFPYFSSCGLVTPSCYTSRW